MAARNIRTPVVVTPTANEGFMASPRPTAVSGPASIPTSKRRPPPADSWASLRRTLRTWDQPRLLGLVQDLFNTVPDAKAAIIGRLTLAQPVEVRHHMLEDLRKRIRKAVRPTRSAWSNPDLRAARRVCDTYLRSTSDADGSLSLYVEMVVSAMALSFEFGGDDSSFYDSIDRAAQAAEKQIPDASDAALIKDLAAQVAALLRNKNFPGWGMDEVIENLAAVLNERADSLASKA